MILLRIDESEATTEIANTREIPCSASEPSRPTSPEEDTEHPFLSLPPSHSRNESRIWEFHGLNESDFVIWEDPDRDSPLILTPLAYSDFEEDKENTYATVSDYDSPDEEEPDVHRIDWARVRAGPHDVFGLPVNTPFGPALPDIPGSGIFNPNLVPTVADTSVRPAVRAIFQDEEESEGEWDDSLSTAQIRELQELNDIYSRAAEHRRHHDRHFPMRDMNVQGQTNIFLEARRITGFQRHEARRHSRGVDEED